MRLGKFGFEAQSFGMMFDRLIVLSLFRAQKSQVGVSPGIDRYDTQSFIVELDRRFEFAELREALRYMERAKHFGKLVLERGT